MFAPGPAALRVRLGCEASAIFDDEAVAAREAGKAILDPLDIDEAHDLAFEQRVLDGWGHCAEPRFYGA
jgi:hypothetical protein